MSLLTTVVSAQFYHSSWLTSAPTVTGTVCATLTRGNVIVMRGSKALVVQLTAGVEDMATVNQVDSFYEVLNGVPLKSVISKKFG